MHGYKKREAIKIIFLIPDDVIYNLLNDNSFVAHEYKLPEGSLHVIITEDTSNRDKILSEYDDKQGLIMILRLSQKDILALKEDTPGFHYEENIEGIFPVNVYLINEKYWNRRKKVRIKK